MEPRASAPSVEAVLKHPKNLTVAEQKQEAAPTTGVTPDMQHAGSRNSETRKMNHLVDLRRLPVVVH